MLYKDLFDYNEHCEKINFNNASLDKDGICIVMCTWKRLQYLQNTITMLEEQNIKQKINFFIWNNNDDISFFTTIKSNIININIHHSPINIGGMGRFILIKYICTKLYNFSSVIFIDDDQLFNNNTIEILLNNFNKNESCHWSGKIFNKSSYWKGISNIYHSDGEHYKYLDYGGTGFMIINTECFLTEDFYKFNKKYLFIEDLWMSYYVSKKLGYRLKNGKDLKNNVKIINGENNSVIAQVNLLRTLKIEFLEILRKEGEWNV
jgi:hypothetical protein